MCEVVDISFTFWADTVTYASTTPRKLSSTTSVDDDAHSAGFPFFHRLTCTDMVYWTRGSPTTMRISVVI